MLHTLIAAGVLLSGSTASAAHESTLARQAQSLACLASEMENTFVEDLRQTHRHYPVSTGELRFRESLCQLATIAGQFRCAVDRCSPCCELERGFAALQEAFDCVEGCADCVKVCACVRGMMHRFEQTMDCVEDAGFVVTSQRQPDFEHQHYHHEHLEGSNTGGILFRVPLPGFRQPTR